jgi:hypothetical protein
MKELDRTLEQDRKLKEFMATKIADRTEKTAEKAFADELKPLEAGNKVISTEHLAESLESYQTAFEEIQKVTQINDIGELVEKFKEVEDQNFSLFNFVNEINNDIEMEAEGIVSIQRKMDQLKIENVEAEHKRADILKGLEEKMADAESKYSLYMSQIEKLNQLLSDMKQGVEELSESVQLPPKTETVATTDNPPAKIEEKKVEFATPAVVTSPESSILSSLGYIEQKTNDLLTLHLAVNAPKSRNQIVIGEDGLPKEVSSLAGGLTGGLLGQGPTAPVGRLMIVAPSTG